MNAHRAESVKEVPFVRKPRVSGNSEALSLPKLSFGSPVSLLSLFPLLSLSLLSPAARENPIYGNLQQHFTPLHFYIPPFFGNWISGERGERRERAKSGRGKREQIPAPINLSAKQQDGEAQLPSER